MAHIKEIIQYCDSTLEPQKYTDYCHNGLQVEGCADVQVIVSGVSVNAALIDAAIDYNADMILAHHGIFWHKEAPILTGVKRARLAKILTHDINVLAYHLPLDCHKTLGNNVLLGEHLDWQIDRFFPLFGTNDLGVLGRLKSPMTIAVFTALCAEKFGQAPIVVSPTISRDIQTVAWCTGAAQDGIEVAHALGADVFVSGEIAERTPALAQEMGMHYLAVGHHASERYGVSALGVSLANHFGITHHFVDIPNTV